MKSTKTTQTFNTRGSAQFSIFLSSCFNALLWREETGKQVNLRMNFGMIPHAFSQGNQPSQFAWSWGISWDVGFSALKLWQSNKWDGGSLYFQPSILFPASFVLKSACILGCSFFHFPSSVNILHPVFQSLLRELTFHEARPFSVVKGGGLCFIWTPLLLF